jgi:uncharacterized membrane protein
VDFVAISLLLLSLLSLLLLVMPAAVIEDYVHSMTFDLLLIGVFRILMLRYSGVKRESASDGKF